MTTLIHVLGSDIPHHNTTILRFFDQVLAAEQPPPRISHFMVATADPDRLPVCPTLEIATYPNKKQLAQAVIAKARLDRQSRFLFHGQFNAWLWLALLTGQIKRYQAYWHIWGADWYQVSSNWKFRLFYRLRRFAQGKVKHIFATRGDIVAVQQYFPSIPASLLYFPTRLDLTAKPAKEKSALNTPLTIIVGNSGDRSNRHLEALQAIYQQFGSNVRLIIPLGYPTNNQAYIEVIRAKAENYFPPQNVRLITDKLDFDEYLILLAHCDLGYFIYQRQQGIGTLSLLIQHNIPFVLSKDNPFCLDLIEQQIPVLLLDEKLDIARIITAQQQLHKLNKAQIAFFPPNYLAGWHQALTLISEDKP